MKQVKSWEELAVLSEAPILRRNIARDNVYGRDQVEISVVVSVHFDAIMLHGGYNINFLPLN